MYSIRIQGCVKVGMNINYASPEGYKPLESVVDEAIGVAQKTGQVISARKTAVDAIENADIIYTDVWVSMGKKRMKRRK